LKHKYLILAFVLLVFSVTPVVAQLHLKEGAFVEINEGTNVSFTGSSNHLTISDSSSLVNNGTVIFSGGAVISEQAGYPVTGDGYETSTVVSPQTSVVFNPANLGLSVTIDSAVSSFTVNRYHSDTLTVMGTDPGINRYYSVNSIGNPGEIQLVFQYDSTELNGLDNSTLQLIGGNNLNIRNEGGQVFSNSVSAITADSLFWFTLSNSFFQFLSLTDLNYCSGDSIALIIDKSGIFNLENEFIFWIDNGSDSIFLASTLLDSVNTIIPSNTNAGVYTVYAKSSSIENFSTNTHTITVHSIPVIDTSSVIDEYCINTSPQLPGFLPAGGSLSGNGASSGTFVPSMAGTGFHQLEYSFTDSNGCFNSTAMEFQVYDVPLATLSSVGDLCENNTPLILNNGSPVGGTYSGNGVSGSQLDPSIAGSGVHSLDYIYTDSLGCSDTASITYEVLSSPVVTHSSLSGVCADSDPLILAGGTPSGGNYTGTAVSAGVFDPFVSGAGNFTINYIYADTNGCSDTAMLIQDVYALPNVTLAPFADLCSNDLSQPLNNGTPSGGIYTGTGITNNEFDPSVSGVGVFEIVYSFTDLNGCSSQDTSEIEVLQSPSAPSLAQSVDTLQSLITADSYQWYFNGNTISDAFSQSYIVSQNGIYQVEIFSSNGCSAISGPFDFQSINVAEIDPEFSISIYPNPTNGIIIIEAGTSDPVNIFIYDISGRLLLSFMNQGGTQKMIDLQNLNSGSYILKIENAKQESIQKNIIRQ
jgi:hypothetical protein